MEGKSFHLSSCLPCFNSIHLTSPHLNAHKTFLFFKQRLLLLPNRAYFSFFSQLLNNYYTRRKEEETTTLN